MIAAATDRSKLQSTIADIVRAAKVKLDECLIATYFGKFMVSCHVQAGVLNHIKVNTKRTSLYLPGQRADRANVDDVLRKLRLVFENEVGSKFRHDYHGMVLMSWDVTDGRLSECPEVCEEQVHKITSAGR